MGPRGGSSKITKKEDRLEKWLELKDTPDSEEDEDEVDADGPLPHQEYIDRMAQTPHAAGAAGSAAGSSESTTRPQIDTNVSVETLSEAQLNALMAVATAEKQRRAAGAQGRASEG